jgi:biopolymer transport protein ExbD
MMLPEGAARARGRRALDAGVNLVPFIDLLSCCIAFLLITAVWTTVARIDVAHGNGGENADGDQLPAATPWTLHVALDRWTLERGDTALPVAATTLAATLRAQEVVESLAVRADDAVPYAMLIGALDRVRDAGVRTVAVRGE